VGEDQRRDQEGSLDQRESFFIVSIWGFQDDKCESVRCYTGESGGVGGRSGDV